MHGVFPSSSREFRIFTERSISLEWYRRQRRDCYAIHAGRNLPAKEFRYLRTVRVTAAVYSGFRSRRKPVPLALEHRAGLRPYTSSWRESHYKHWLSVPAASLLQRGAVGPFHPPTCHPDDEAGQQESKWSRGVPFDMPTIEVTKPSPARLGAGGGANHAVHGRRRFHILQSPVFLVNSHPFRFRDTFDTWVGLVSSVHHIPKLRSNFAEFL